MFCQYCGKPLPKGAYACPCCGRKARMRLDDIFDVISLVSFSLVFVLLFVSIMVAWFADALAGFWITIPAIILIAIGLGFFIPSLVIKKKNS